MSVEVDESAAGTVYATKRKPYTKLWILIAAGLALIVVGVLMGLRMTTKQPPRLTPAGLVIAGVPVGGLDQKQLRAAVDDKVRAQVEKPIAVDVTGAKQTFTVDPVTAGITLDVDATVTQETAVIAVDAVKLSAALAAQGQKATDGTVKLAAPTPRLEDKGDTSFTALTAGVTRTAGKPGWSLDPAAAAKAIQTAAKEGTGKATVTSLAVKPGTVPANLDGVDQLIGTFTTYHPCCASRVTNIHLIAKLVDGTVIAPGTTFSLNAKVGERTAAKGFVPAPAIVNGEIQNQLGGGVSQFSTTLFNAAWFSGLPILKHQPHSKYISRYPPGREATLDWGNIDQVIRNDTSAPVVIRARTTDTSVTVALYGHTGDRKVTSVTGPRNPVGTDGGFSVSVTRTVLDDGSKTGTATLHWTYTGLD